MKVRKLQSRTGKGVRIGDNESQIVSRLGRPSKIEQTSTREQVRVFRYAKSGETNELYKFKQGKLVEIEIRPKRDDYED